MVPEMIRRGYSKYLSIGPIMGVGRPRGDHSAFGAHRAARHARPTDVGALLIAGVLPGLVLATHVRRADLGLDGDRTRSRRRPTRSTPVSRREEARG